MRWKHLTFTLSVHGTLLAVLLMPCIADGQESELAARKGFTGKQLFEHQWKWVDSPSREIEVPFVVSGGTVVTGTPAVNRRPAESGGRVVSGRSGFKRVGVLGDGLGPLHNATSCAQCHVDGGASGVEHNVTLITVDPRSQAVSVKEPDNKELINKELGGRHLLEVFPGLLGPLGRLTFSTVVHDRSTRPGYSVIRNRLAKYVPGGIENRWFQSEQRNSAAIARQPVVAGRHGTVDFYLSQRNSPALFGAGLIDSISDVRILALAKRQVTKSDGRITGRFVGKFGWRGQVRSLSAFVTQACAGELGLSQGSGAVPPVVSGRAAGRPVRPGLVAVSTATQAGDPADFEYANLGSDMTRDEVRELTRFVASLPRPTEKPPHGRTSGEVLKGERLFGSIGCSACHVADLRPTSGMFSDLLLHDMGPQLQSPFPAPLGATRTMDVITTPRFAARGPSVSSSQQYYGSGDSVSPLPKPIAFAEPEQPRFPRGMVPQSDSWSWDALQREWRTPPLWGVADTAPYLHDGRAETLEESILWHGGEAESSRVGYTDLPQGEKDLVLAFLSSLRAPKTAAARDD